MSRFILTLLFHIGFGFGLAHAERIDPRGLIGTLILSPSAEADSALADELFAAGEPAGPVGIVTDESVPYAAITSVLDGCARHGVREIRFARHRPDPSGAGFLDDVKHLVILGNSRLDAHLSRLCAQVLKRKGGVAILGGGFRSAFRSECRADSKGVQQHFLLPGLMLADSGQTAEEIARDLREIGRLPGIACLMDGRARIVFRGRRIYGGQGQGAKLILPAQPGKPSVFETSAKPLDLTALRRACQDRLSPDGIGAWDGAPCVQTGTLVLAGGGRLPDSIIDTFVELAGGEQGVIAVLPTAVADPDPDEHRMASRFIQAGVEDVVVLPQRTVPEVESADFLRTLGRATGVWFAGGRQWRFVDAYESTKAEHALRQVLRRGGVIGGSSAGASIQAQYLARGNPLGNQDIMAEGYERGLGYLPGTAVDQHFSQRNRLPQLKQLVKRYPRLLGIGLDEASALVVQKSEARVVGQGNVYFVWSSGGPDGPNVTLKKPADCVRLNCIRN